MRAGALFAPTTDQRPTPAAAASGLLALSGLGQADLAVVLLVDLWSGDRTMVSTETAVLVDARGVAAGFAVVAATLLLAPESGGG